MTVQAFATRLGHFLLGIFVLVGFSPSRALAQDHETHALTSRGSALDQKSALVKVVRESTERFRDVSVAEAEGYGLLFGCVSGPDFGAMGMHFVKGAFLDDEVDATRPEIVIYEPLANGRLRLVGADYLVFKDAWDAEHPEGPPQLMGQLFHLFEAPNRFGLPAFYTLHVWAWKESPTGTFVNWHPRISCDAFSGQNK
jgi:hypothetical protein